MNNDCIAGCFIALVTALPREAADRALETLWTLAADHRTPECEAKFYRDLADSVAEVRTPSPSLAEIASYLETLH